MGRLHSKTRTIKIKQRQRRRFKLAKLRKKYHLTDNIIEKEKILEKIIKISPALEKKEFLKPLKDKDKGKDK